MQTYHILLKSDQGGFNAEVSAPTGLAAIVEATKAAVERHPSDTNWQTFAAYVADPVI